MTYPNGAVREVLSTRTVPVRADVLKERDLAKRLRAYWTPMFFSLGPDGTEYHRAIGFLPPEDFAARALLGAGLAYMQMNRLDPAVECFTDAKARFERTEAAAESAYWLGVCGFRRTKDTRPIYEACKEVVERWPHSQWARTISFVGRYKDFNLKP